MLLPDFLLETKSTLRKAGFDYGLVYGEGALRFLKFILVL